MLSGLLLFGLILGCAGCMSLQNYEEETGHEELMEGSFAYSKEGWTFLHIEGSPYSCGYQYGYFLAPNITDYIKFEADGCSDFLVDWETVRELAVEYYWDFLPEQMLQEMQGMVDGIEKRGLNSPFERPIDVRDILALNALIDLYYHESAKREGTLVDLQGLQEVNYAFLPIRGCSAFVATGSATRGGQPVIGHSTWCGYPGATSNYFVIDIQPEKGYGYMMQTQPGLFWSVEDWYITEAGLAVAETTLDNGPIDPDGVPLFIRIREALSKSDSVDDFAAYMIKSNNGAYPCDWLIADANTGEIGILELGLKERELKKTQDGFYGSCNLAWDPEVREEQGGGPMERDACYPRWDRWDQLAQENWGKIDPEVGKKMLSDHYNPIEDRDSPTSRTICGHYEDDPQSNFRLHGAIDGKVADGEMIRNMAFWARRGHPCGQDFIASDFFANHPEKKTTYMNVKEYITDLKSFSWTVLTPQEIQK